MLATVGSAPASIPELTVLAGFLAVGLALVHVFSGHLHFLRVIPRSRILSLGSGASVAYVFVHVLPDLSEAQTSIQESFGPALAFLELHVYLVALLGMVTFYGLERAAKLSRQRKQDLGQGNATTLQVFWLHVGSFAVYNALIGYLLVHREIPGRASLFWFAIAMALHFTVNDHGLREHHKKKYDHIGRWVLAAAIIVGWVIGSNTKIAEGAIAILFSFLAGSIMLNVLKEELPEERESRFWAFALGAAGYAALLIVF